MPVYKSKDGRWFVQVNYTKNGKHLQRKKTGFKTKAEAKEYEPILINESKNYAIGANKLTFEELYNEYILTHSKELKASTLRHYRSYMKNNILPFIGNVRIVDIDKQELLRLRNSIDNFNFSTTNKNSCIRYFKSVFNYGVKIYDLNPNVLSVLTKYKDNTIKEEVIHFWTYDDFKRFQSALKIECDFKDNVSQLRWYSYYVAFNVLFFSGLRLGEMKALKWNDLILVNGSYFINVTKSLNTKANPPELSTPKNKSSIRKVPISKELLNILLEHKERCKDIYPYFDEKLFYICGTLTPITDTTLCNIKNKFANTCSLPQIRIHDFRHSYCSLLLNANIPILTVSKLLGHTTIDQTQKVYAHMFPNQAQNVIEYLDSLK